MLRLEAVNVVLPFDKSGLDNCFGLFYASFRATRPHRVSAPICDFSGAEQKTSGIASVSLDRSDRLGNGASGRNDEVRQ